MFKNYFVVALRTLLREKMYAIINILGLSLAITCCLILVIFTRSELNYDQYHLKHQQIYRVANEYNNSGNTTRYAIISPSFAPLFFREYPQVGEFVRFRNRAIDNRLFRSGENEFYWENVWMADSNVFDVFTHEVIFGNLEGALDDPHSIVLSETFSNTYFGGENPVGRTLATDTATYTITAVFKDFPDNVHLKYDALLSMNLLLNFGGGEENLSPRQLFSIGTGGGPTYFHVAPDISVQDFQGLLDEFYVNIMEDLGEGIGTSVNFYAHPLLDVHFDNRFVTGGPATGNIFYVYGFIAVALFVLIVACINYTNLATARASKRAKEVGMRKLMGAGRSQLITQFIGESVMYALLALVIGFLFVEVVEQVTPLASWLGKSHLLQLTQETTLIVWIVLGTLLVGILAGAYPAFYLSLIAPLSAISSSKKPKGSRFQLRQILIFIQFFVSVSVVACTLLMTVQMEYVASKPLGYDTENIISVKLRGADVIEQISVIRNELLSNSNVLSIADTSIVPGVEPGNVLVRMEANDGEPVRAYSDFVYGGAGFVDVMGFEITQGRDFSERLPADSSRPVIVNEALVNKMGWDNPIGKQIISFNGIVVGVVRDFHLLSLHNLIEPMMILPFRESNSNNPSSPQLDIETRDLVIRIAGVNIDRTINHIESVMIDLDPFHPFEFQFYGDSLNEQYRNDIELMSLTGAFAVICIFISCLGLFGLTAFTAVQRTKELGIRKVLGASIMQIIFLLARHQMAMIVVAAVIASAISYTVMDNWMSSFAYRTNIPLWTFFVATSGVVIVAFLTIALQSIKIAQSNPVDALRYE